MIIKAGQLAETMKDGIKKPASLPSGGNRFFRGAASAMDEKKSRLAPVVSLPGKLKEAAAPDDSSSDESEGKKSYLENTAKRLASLKGRTIG